MLAPPLFSSSRMDESLAAEEGGDSITRDVIVFVRVSFLPQFLSAPLLCYSGGEKGGGKGDPYRISHLPAKKGG